MKTVVTWLWDGWRNIYKPEHVYRMRDMLQHHMQPHRFVCVTDKPEKLQGVETVKLWSEHSMPRRKKHLPNCYRRLFLFSREAKEIFGESVISIDIDAIVLDDISNLFNDSPFKILKGFCNPYNGSLWQVMPGSFPHVWENLTPQLMDEATRYMHKQGLRRYGSDQTIMAHCVPNAPTWDESNGIYQYTKIGNKIPDNAKILFFAGNQKPWDSRFNNLYWGKA